MVVLIVACCIEIVIGALIVALGLVIWLKKMLKLLHAYHYKKVKEEDVPAYTRLVGISLILIGAGIAVTGVLDLFNIALWWVSLVVGIVAGMTLLFIAQKKYNGSIF